MVQHFVPYGSYNTSCGVKDMPLSYTTDTRINVTCVDCLQVLLSATETRIKMDIATQLEKSLSVPASEGWQEQIAQALIKSFEVGEDYVIDNLERELMQLLVDWDSSEGFKDDVMYVINQNRKKRETSE